MECKVYWSSVMGNRTFAFTLSGECRSDGKWKAREGVALAGCAELRPFSGIYRYAIFTVDAGPWC
jgi:hypothetical protein